MIVVVVVIIHPSVGVKHALAPGGTSYALSEAEKSISLGPQL